MSLEYCLFVIPTRVEDSSVSTSFSATVPLLKIGYPQNGQSDSYPILTRVLQSVSVAYIQEISWNDVEDNPINQFLNDNLILSKFESLAGLLP
jgi:hypothetical protein